MQKSSSATNALVRTLSSTSTEILAAKGDKTWKRWPLLLALGALGVICFSIPVRAGDQVPFKGTFNPIVLSVTPLDATHIQFEANVIVLATHLGRASGPGVFILDLATMSYAGTATWVAANGDALYSMFAGQFIPTDTPGFFDNVETFEIVGGTGRFEGATGAGIAAGQFDVTTQSAPAPAPFTGTISSPGSLKH